MNLYGARFDEVIDVINAITREAAWEKTSKKGLYTVTGNISGVQLRVRQQFHDKGLTAISISGNGWLISFVATKRRPMKLPKDQEAIMADLWLAPHPLPHDPCKRQTGCVCLHTPVVISPEQFQTEMALLRMFDTEWAATHLLKL